MARKPKKVIKVDFKEEMKKFDQKDSDLSDENLDEEDGDDDEEFGEDEMSEMESQSEGPEGDEKNDEDDEGSVDSDPYGDEDDSSDDEEGTKKKKKKKNQKNELVIKEVPADPYLVRREATLLNMVLKHFKKRVIIFFNEKVQCHRMLILFKIFGLPAVQVQGNLT